MKKGGEFCAYRAFRGKNERKNRGDNLRRVVKLCAKEKRPSKVLCQWETEYRRKGGKKQMPGAQTGGKKE